EMTAWLASLDPPRCDADCPTFISGHFGYGVHNRLPGVHQTFTFLRNPIDQTLSMHYESVKRRDLYPQGTLEALLSSNSGEPYFGDPQVRHLAATNGVPIRGALTIRHLEQAKKVVTEELSCFGLTEYFGSSLKLIDQCLGTHLTVRRENISDRNRQDPEPRLL